MIEFHELTNEVSEVGDGDYSAVSNATNHTRKISGLNLKKQMAQNTLKDNIAPEFSTETAYTKGQFVIYQGKIYQFTSDHSAGAWNASHATVSGQSALLKMTVENALASIKDIPTSISQFRAGDVIPVDGPNGPAKMRSRDLQTAILGGPIDEAVQQWLNEHPEATTTVQDGAVTDIKLNQSIRFNRAADSSKMGYCLLSDGSPFASQVTAANTIYEIRWNFDLEESIVSIPANCILKFNGGKIINGDIIGDNTYIEGKGFCFDNVKLKGSFTNGSFNVTWFGVVGDGITDNTTAIQNAVDNIQVGFADTKAGFTLFFPQGRYCVSSEITLKSFVKIKGLGKNLNPNNKSDNTLVLTSGNSSIFRIDGHSRDVTIEGINFECYNNEYWQNATNAIKMQPLQSENGVGSSKRFTLINSSFIGFCRCLSIERGLISDGSAKSNNNWQADGIVINKCNFSYCFDSCIYCETSNGLDYSVIEGCSFSVYGDENDKYCINLVRSGFLRVCSCAAAGAISLAHTHLINKTDYTGPLELNSVQAESIGSYGVLQGLVSIVNSVFDHSIELSGVTGRILSNRYTASPSLLVGANCRLNTDAVQEKIKVTGLDSSITRFSYNSECLLDSNDTPIFFPYNEQRKTFSAATATEESKTLFQGVKKKYTACMYKFVMKISMTSNNSGHYRVVYNQGVSGQQVIIPTQTEEGAQTFEYIINDTLNWTGMDIKLFCANCTVSYSFVLEQLKSNSF